MKTPVTILFLYGESNGYCIRECEELEKIEDAIRYWLGKSPGIHREEMEHLYVVENGALREYMPVIEKLREEEYSYEQKMREQAERNEFERLKKKFGS